MIDNDRLPGPNGEPGKGMKISEALDHAEIWWDTKARYRMPDHGQPPEQCGTPSPIIRGLEWSYLGKKDRLQVIKTWYSQVGVHTLEGKDVG